MNLALHATFASIKASRINDRVFIPLHSFDATLHCDGCKEDTPAVVFIDPDVTDGQIPFEALCDACAKLRYGKDWEAAFLEIVTNRMTGK